MASTPSSYRMRIFSVAPRAAPESAKAWEVVNAADNGSTSDNGSTRKASKDNRSPTRNILFFMIEKPFNNRNGQPLDRKSTRLNSSHVAISYAVFCLKKKK